MSLKGDLGTMPLPDVLQWVAAGRKTGTLHLAHHSIKKRIILREGRLHSSWSNDPRESLGQFLVRLELATEEQLFRALLEQEAKGRLFGSILIDRGVLSEEDLRRALRLKAEETIFDVFLWPGGDFEFREGEIPGDLAITIEMPVTPVILEGIRRVDEWRRIRATFPTSETSFRRTGTETETSDPVARELLGLAAAGKTLAAMSLELRRSEFETAALAFQLHARGLLAIENVGQKLDTTDPVSAIAERLALARRRLDERRYDAAIEAYQDVLALDRLNQHAKKGLQAAAAAREHERQTRAIPRDRVPRIVIDFAALTQQNLDPQEGFVLSRVNGEWDVQSILKLCPMDEDSALLIFARLLDRKLIELS